MIAGSLLLPLPAAAISIWTITGDLDHIWIVGERCARCARCACRAHRAALGQARAAARPRWPSPRRRRLALHSRPGVDHVRSAPTTRLPSLLPVCRRLLLPLQRARRLHGAAGQGHHAP